MVFPRGALSKTAAVHTIIASACACACASLSAMAPGWVEVDQILDLCLEQRMPFQTDGKSMEADAQKRQIMIWNMAVIGMLAFQYFMMSYSRVETTRTASSDGCSKTAKSWRLRLACSKSSPDRMLR
jgi:hypothetical protein